MRRHAGHTGAAGRGRRTSSGVGAFYANVMKSPLPTPGLRRIARSRTTMHCPTCRHDNPATTRFCSACGAVLVESAPDGGRRRVLRPWGMRRTAPPTISPDMPDLADAAIPTRGTRLDPAVRFDFWIIGALVVAVVAVAWIRGSARPGRSACTTRARRWPRGRQPTFPPRRRRSCRRPASRRRPWSTYRRGDPTPAGDAPRHCCRATAGTCPGAGPRGDPRRRRGAARRNRLDVGRSDAPAPPVAPVQAPRRRCPIAGSP